MKGEPYSRSKVVKITRQTGLNWVDALPLALMHYKTQTHSNTYLTSHEMLIGRPISNASCRGPYKGPPLD